jgi:ABC-type lipoprotein export system ATPase subunit
MSTLRFHETTTSTPEQFIAALTDFGSGRSQKDIVMSHEQRDVAVRHHIERLVNEEHSLHQKKALSGGDQQRLSAIQAELDHCWDVLSRRETLGASRKSTDKEAVRP